MGDTQPTDKSLHDLVEIIHFTESVSAKIHGLMAENEIYETLVKEFARSKRYTASVLLLVDDGSKLRIVGTSEPARKLKLGEKLGRVQMNTYRIDLNKSRIYSQVVRKGKTIQHDIGDLLRELFPLPLANVMSKAMRYDKEYGILTPLKRHGTIIGALAITSTELAEHFIPSVRNLAQHISAALELADEHAERKKAEEELLRLSSAVKMSTDAIVISDLDAKIIDANEATLRMYGTDDKGDLVGKNAFDLIVPEDRAMALKDMKEVLKKGYAISREYQVITKDGSRIPVEMNTAIMKDADGKPIGFVGISRDISERKRAEQELRSSREQLRSLSAHLQSMKEEERASIAREIHDELGQTLTALKMGLSWLKSKLPKGEESLHNRAKLMLGFTDMAIETVKRISTELRPGVLDDLGLTAAIEWQAEKFQDRMGIRCEVTIDPEDIALAKDLSTTVFRIFQEALTNVARHANATRVRVSLREKDGHVQLRVRDNGRGITAEQISRPESFGLLGMRERVHFWGGDVKIKGIKNRGTTLTVTIPLKK